MLHNFNVNKYINLKLIGNKTIIYVSGIPFKQCKNLDFDYEAFKSNTSGDFKPYNEKFKEKNNSIKNANIIPPEAEFWGHCSIIQFWVENNYDTRLLHYTLAFPLLKKLAEAGDRIALRVFKREIESRLKTGNPTVVNYLTKENYTGYLDSKEIITLTSIRDVKITLSLIFINIFLFILTNFVLHNDAIILLNQANQKIIYELELWRLFTSLFIHVNILHLLLNMLLLSLFGLILECDQQISGLEYITIFLLSGLLGNISYLYLMPITTISQGASGSIFGLMGASAIVFKTKKQFLLLLLLSFVILFFLYVSLAPVIIFWAHLFGFLGGLTIEFAFDFMRKKTTLQELNQDKSR